MKCIAFLEINFDYRIVLLLFIVIFVKYVKKVLFCICYVKPHWNRKPKDEKGFKTFWVMKIKPSSTTKDHKVIAFKEKALALERKHII